MSHVDSHRIDASTQDSSEFDRTAAERDSANSDSRLVESARRGDRHAFGELVQRYEHRLWKVIYRFVRDRELTDDLSQETFLRAFERLEQFDPARRFAPWLFRIGVNLTLDYLRKKKRRKWTSVFSDGPEDRSMDPPSEDPREALDLRQEVQLVLEEIPEKYRIVLVLRELENFSTSEIAAITDRKEATVRWRLAEARDRFQKAWTRRMESQNVISP